MEITHHRENHEKIVEIIKNLSVARNIKEHENLDNAPIAVLKKVRENYPCEDLIVVKINSCLISDKIKSIDVISYSLSTQRFSILTLYYDFASAEVAGDEFFGITGKQLTNTRVLSQEVVKTVENFYNNIPDQFDLLKTGKDIKFSGSNPVFCTITLQGDGSNCEFFGRGVNMQMAYTEAYVRMRRLIDPPNVDIYQWGML